MRLKSETQGTSEKLGKDIRRVTRKQYSAEEKIRIVLDGLRGEYSIAELYRREGFAESLDFIRSATVVDQFLNMLPTIMTSLNVCG